jgi:actin-related protein 5
LETKLLSYDPTFTPAQTFLARSQQSNSLLTAFLRGDDKYDPDSLEQSYQLHLNIERSRVPECWFQPGMAGLDSAGVGEIVEHVLRERSVSERQKIQQNFFLTGGASILPGLVARMNATMRPVLPFQSTFHVRTPAVKKEEVRLDAWRGMAEWSRGDEFASACISKKEYEEYGGEVSHPLHLGDRVRVEDGSELIHLPLCCLTVRERASVGELEDWLRGEKMSQGCNVMPSRLMYNSD